MMPLPTCFEQKHSALFHALTLVGDDADAVEAVALEHAADAVVAEHLERALQEMQDEQTQE